MNAELKNLYLDLYKKVIEKNNKNEKKVLTICPAIKGEQYKNGGIMFVGRAINGWCPLQGSVKDDDIISRLEKCEGCTLDWVVGENTWTHCVNNCCPFAREGKTDGRASLSPFWQMVKFLCEKENLGEQWYKKIIWSNLYKASYVIGGNPVDFYKDQIKECNDILIEDIKENKPSKIYFITEKNSADNKSKRTWFCDKYKDQGLTFKSVYEYLEKNGQIKVFVLTRPEFQDKDEIYKNMENLNKEKVKLN